MRYVSLFSGIEAASVAWESLGWEPVAFSEIDKFPCKLLKRRFPDVPNLGDISNIDWSCIHGSVDLVIGGSPCQSFSVAGLRKGLMDPRGNLMLEYLRAVDFIRPKWVIWENVPGVLSSGGGRDFAALRGGLEELGYGVAYRVLDAQFFGVAQRRRRVFVVGCAGRQWQRAAAVLFEPDSMSGNTKTSAGKREEIAGRSRECPDYCVGDDNGKSGIGIDISPTLKSGGGKPYVMSPSFSKRPGQQIATRKDGLSYAITTGEPPRVLTSGLRRLTPLECERLQGFPDGWTQIGNTSDSARYKALGNSMAVPVINWIGKRIELVEKVSEVMIWEK